MQSQPQPGNFDGQGMHAVSAAAWQLNVMGKVSGKVCAHSRSLAAILTDKEGMQSQPQPSNFNGQWTRYALSAWQL
jgi:hypothetical protein